MIEAIVALSIAVVGLLGILALISRSVSLNRVVADRYVAAYLATEGVEIVKNLVDRNSSAGRPWNSEISSGEFEADYNDSALGINSSRPLQFDSGSGIYSYDLGEPTRFQRKIAVQLSADGESMKINSIVDWTSRGGGDFELNVEEHFLNWRL